MKKSVWVIVSVCWLGLLACTGKGDYIEESGSVFHTLYRIKYQSPRFLTEEIDKELQDFNLSLNPFNPNSIIAKVNNNEPVEVDEWFADVFNKAQEISERTDGIFDATGAPLFNLWGFGFSKMDSVTPQMIDSTMAFVGYKKIRLEGKQVVKDDPRVMLNFSAIAKGYACDVVARVLEREGVENYMVNIGGEIVIKGVNQYGICWRTGIQIPEDDLEGMKEEAEVIIQPCKPCGVATSGDYRNYYEKDGKRYGHTINPHTGYPAAQNILSATVVAENCMIADGYATALMASGSDKAIEMARSIPEIEYYLIYLDEQGKQRAAHSEGMLTYLLNRKALEALDILENP
ncbi:MAG: FAD:protein FMN transferase [Tannerellaceae bacterium]|nr:FAD:protein FMN transferase [Tannerellaceae bacterium]